MQDIKIIGDREDKSIDARAGTQCSKLASALLVMGFKLAPQPFTTLPTMRGGAVVGAVTTIWFIPVIKFGDGALPMEEVEREWRFRQDTQANESRIPQVVWMRLALMARQEIVKNIIPNASKESVNIGSAWFVTDNLKLASCLMGAGYKLNLYKDRRFYFNPDAARAAGIWMREGGNESMQWMKLACFQIEKLIDAIRGPGNAPLIQVRNATTNAVLTMSSATPPELQRGLLNELHR